MVDALVEWADVIAEHGVEARPGAGRHQRRGRARRPRRDRAALLDEQGDDANASEQRVELIRKLG